jgi:hypothetical protein
LFLNYRTFVSTIRREMFPNEKLAGPEVFVTEQGNKMTNLKESLFLFNRIVKGAKKEAGDSSEAIKIKAGDVRKVVATMASISPDEWMRQIAPELQNHVRNR